MNSPADIIRLIDLGLPIKTINIGNMGGKDDTHVVKKYVNVTDEQEQQFRDLLARGIEITTQLVPQDPVTHLTDFLKQAQSRVGRQRTRPLFLRAGSSRRPGASRSMRARRAVWHAWAQNPAYASCSQRPKEGEDLHEQDRRAFQGRDHQAHR